MRIWSCAPHPRCALHHGTRDRLSGDWSGAPLLGAQSAAPRLDRRRSAGCDLPRETARMRSWRGPRKGQENARDSTVNCPTSQVGECRAYLHGDTSPNTPSPTSCRDSRAHSADGRNRFQQNRAVLGLFRGGFEQIWGMCGSILVCSTKVIKTRSVTDTCWSGFKPTR